MKNTMKLLRRMVFLMLCAALLCHAVFAVSCSLRVTLLDANEQPIANMGVEICRVAALENDRFVLTQEFAALGIAPEDLIGADTVDAAQAAYQYILANELEGTILLTGSRGWVDFTALEEGIYLVFERGGQIVSFHPYFVALPTEQDGQLYYNIHSTPKAISDDSRSILVMKQWEDNGDRLGLRPNHIKVTLYRDGIAIRTVVLNEKCGWQHTFQMLPGEGEYTVEEAPVRHYEFTCEEVAEGFVLINTYTPSSGPDDPPDVGGDEIDPPDDPIPPAEPDDTQTPEEPSLPQTGFQMWPVYLLLGLGSALVIWGLAEVCLRREDT